LLQVPILRQKGKNKNKKIKNLIFCFTLFVFPKKGINPFDQISYKVIPTEYLSLANENFSFNKTSGALHLCGQQNNQKIRKKKKKRTTIILF
jgi:hypothetical protein